MIYPPIAELLPHAGPMILLDRVLMAAPDRLSAKVLIRSDAMFCDGERVGAWVGIEYMAQTIAAMAGWTAKLNNLPVRIGFLVGARQYVSQVAWFKVNEVLHVHAERLIDGADGVSAVNCRIVTPAGQLYAEATLTVFQPDNLEEFLKHHE